MVLVPVDSGFHLDSGDAGLSHSSASFQLRDLGQKVSFQNEPRFLTGKM